MEKASAELGNENEDQVRVDTSSGKGVVAKWVFKEGVRMGKR
jgi:hypothetical protein